jgi:TRAP-type mannitol/chloroaromatic compound transport system substrate-binding protein
MLDVSAFTAAIAAGGAHWVPRPRNDGSAPVPRQSTSEETTMQFRRHWLVAGAVALAASFSTGAAWAQAAPKPVKIRVQAVIPKTADEVRMFEQFAENVKALTGGTVTFEVLPAGAIVGVAETLDAVDKGLIEGGLAWTHFWSGKHPATMLFGSPIAGAGLGMDNFAWVSWYMNGGGKALYEQLWTEMKMNVKGIMLQPVGPEALGWFKTPINSMADFRKMRFRTPPGIPLESYKEIGVAAVSIGGGDILPALEKGTIDGAEWCCPKPDMTFGFHKVLKHYYMQGLHQVVVNADMYLNKKVWDGMSAHQKKSIEVAADASLMQTVAYRIHENGKALKELVEKHGVILHDTPKDYFTEYNKGSQALIKKYSDANPFFKKVHDSMREFAETAIPFWAQAQRLNANLAQEYAAELAEEEVAPSAARCAPAERTPGRRCDGPGAVGGIRPLAQLNW